MSTDRDVTRIVRSWLELGATALPDRVLDTVLDQLPATPQRRAWWPAWRFQGMNAITKVAGVAAAVAVVAVVGISLLPGSGGVGGRPTMSVPASNPRVSASASPAADSRPSVPVGYRESRPFAPGLFGMCPEPNMSECSETATDDTMTFTFRVPEGWAAVEGGGIWLADEEARPPAGAAMTITRGNWLHSEPCRTNDSLAADIPVGPTVDDFAEALDSHPLLDVSTPKARSLAGYSGKYLDLQVPADITACVRYRPLEGHIYAQGPSHRWHLWILDVDGVRAVITAADYAGTSAEHRAQLQEIVDSIQIEP